MGLRNRILISALLVCSFLIYPGVTLASGLAQPATPTPDELARQAEEYVIELSNHDFEKASQRFDPSVATPSLTNDLQAAWDSLIQRAGAFKGIADTVSTQESGNHVVYVITDLEKATVDIKVVFSSSGQILGMFYTPGGTAAALSQPFESAPYVNQAAFIEQEVTVGNSEWPLPGTLLLPNGSGPFPAVVLVHGSGPNDRDETIGPNKPFRDLAEGLATHGIASLRYDKRTKVYPAQMAEMAGTLTVKEEAIDDALAAVALLRQTPEIDPEQIFVLGHSLGGMLAPRIAAQDPAVAGIVILAGPTRPLEDIIIDQYTYIGQLDGSISAEEQAEIDSVKRGAEMVKNPDLSLETPAEELLGLPAAYWLDLRTYNPAVTASMLKIPIFSSRGERDYQVTQADFNGWQAALAGQSNVFLKQYPGLNHLFITGQGPSTPAEYSRVGHVSEVVVDDIADFILKGSVNLKPRLIGDILSLNDISRLVLLLVPIWLIQVGLSIYSLIDLRRQRTTRGPRWLWAVLLIVCMFMLPTGLIVCAIYLIWGRKEAEDGDDNSD